MLTPEQAIAIREKAFAFDLRKRQEALKAELKASNDSNTTNRCLVQIDLLKELIDEVLSK